MQVPPAVFEVLYPAPFVVQVYPPLSLPALLGWRFDPLVFSTCILSTRVSSTLILKDSHCRSYPEVGIGVPYTGRNSQRQSHHKQNDNLQEGRGYGTKQDHRNATGP